MIINTMFVNVQFKKNTEIIIMAISDRKILNNMYKKLINHSP